MIIKHDPTTGYYTKKCCRCGHIVVRADRRDIISKFYRDKRRADGLSARCRVCTREVMAMQRIVTR